MPVKDEVDDWVKESGQEQVTSAFSACSSDLEQSREGVGVRKISGPDGIVYEYTYDDNNQLTGVQIPGKGSITFNSYTWNRPDSITLPGGSKKEYVYDPLMRVETITVKDPAQNLLMNHQHTYDQMNNVLSKETENGSYVYGYDQLYRLTSADNPVLDDEGFTYDPVGNRLTAANTSGNWSYNNNNELGGYDNVAFEYDANGNMTMKTAGGVVTNYVCNIEDRLVLVENGAGTDIAAYYYDPFGRRLWKEVSGTTTYFHYSDEGLAGEYDASGTEIKTYGYKPGSTWTTDPLFMKVDNNYYFYQNDHLGTPQKLTSTNGAVAWSAKYSSFGEATVEVETVESNLRFAGQYYDQETGLHYNYHRYYDPRAGRYFRTDPLGFMDGTNLYTYAKNSSTKNYDPFGLLTPPPCEINCCKNCTKRQVQVTEPTGEIDDWTERYWSEYITILLNAAGTAFSALANIGGEPIPPTSVPSMHPHIVGKKHYEAEYKILTCIEEVCNDFLAQPKYYGCEEIGKEWMSYKPSEDIVEYYFY